MRNNPKSIIIHHSLTKDGKVVDWTAITKYHIEHNGWSNNGYHWGIERVGDKWVIQKGRAENVQGAHTKEQGMNVKSIGICVVGNYDIDDLPKQAFDLLVSLIKDINKRYKKSFPIESHNKYAKYKTCPGKKFPLKKLINAVYQKGAA
ncbi:MAG: peptidoglycan recognition protein family protein [Clostridia bacterium]|nr:peptidoglycan recognition protein family protein [Clostridia bacterium]